MNYFVMKKVISKQKQNGEVFTPEYLANFLAGRIVSHLGSANRRTLKVCDPSCGNGALLKAMAKKMLEANFFEFKLHGLDKNPLFVSEASIALEKFSNDIHTAKEKDFIKERECLALTDDEKFDIMIGNPPYVRVQNLGSFYAQRIADIYGLSGRIDLYYPFLINMTESLKEGGILGVITSNKYLSNKSGESIRRYLLTHYDILEIIDLGDTKLFNAAVLPAIFIGRKNSTDAKQACGRYLKIYQNEDGTPPQKDYSSIYEIMTNEDNGVFSVNNANSYKVSSSSFVRPKELTGIWEMIDHSEQMWINTIHNNTSFFLGERFKVRVGVKSCADDVFLSEEHEIEAVFLRSLISQSNLSSWFILPNKQKIIYPHYDNCGSKDVYDIDKYPKAKAFFLRNKERLSRRSYLINSNRLWYELWVPQNPTLWKYPKVVFPDISTEARFALDQTGAIVNGNCYWFYASSPEEEELLYLIMGVANSALMTKYHDLCFNNKLYNGRRRYLAQYVAKYPIPDPKLTSSQKIIQLVKDIIKEKSRPLSQTVIERLNALVCQAFSVV